MPDQYQDGLDMSMIEVRRSDIHGRGLFARRRIRKGQIIGDYDGPVTHRIGAYTLWIEEEDGRIFGISGRNALRFVNHSTRPNAAFYGRTLEAIRTIQPGEEITHHYGDDWTEDAPQAREMAEHAPAAAVA
ncbi:MAG: SET domain-containing protein-lysine N-methyltransferase [Phycisphaeraceae bacterium]|nr:SET domain-containing protein-lysine N-methyltransferase [Phycisphaeraceae bacterium]